MSSWTIAAFTHRGRVRSVNEDAIAVHKRILTGDMTEPLVISAADDCCVLMIADGMGGHAHGAMASRDVLDYLVAAIDRLADPASCAETIEDANQHLFDLMHEHDERLGMGSTIVGAVLKADQLITFNVGDSSSYLLSSGQLLKLSHDDVPEHESYRVGLRRSHAITQALGGTSLPVAVEPHISTDPPLAPRETLLLCSDGITDMVDRHAIESVLSEARTLGESARRLAAMALKAGGRDNLSLIVVCRSDGSA